MRKVNVAVMGATGAVGACFLRILEERMFPVNNIRLLASERSTGKKLKFNGKMYPVEVLTHDSFKGIDIVLASAGASRSLEFLPSAVKAGAVCVDNSSAFRMDDNVPLVVPEVNPEMIKMHKGIIANPNCSTIQMVVALWPIHKKAGIKRIIVTTLQASSGAGHGAVEQLRQENLSIAASGCDNVQVNLENKSMPQQSAYNVFPHIGSFVEGDYTNEEWKLVKETRKIMHDNKIRISATCVRVPVRTGHSESVYIETEKPITPQKVREILSKAPGVSLIDDPANNFYPMPKDIEGKDEVFVGRIRQDAFVKKGLWLWVVADNLRKGAATNAVQIAEVLAKG